MTENIPNIRGELVIVRAGLYRPGTRINTPQPAALLTARAAGAPAVTAQFNVTYHGFSNAAKKAFQAAVDVWSVTLTTSVPIRVDAYWTPLGPGILGSAGPEAFYRDFSGAPQAGTWYPVALANKLQGSDLTPGNPHITVNFNSNYPNWYLGIDGATPPNQYDLMSVILHELGHGLGFIGSMSVRNDGLGEWGLKTGFPIIYDRFAVNARGERLLDTSLFPNPSIALAGELQSNQLFLDGPQAQASNGGIPVRIYAPVIWDTGSSFSHLDEVTYPSGNANSLMTPQIAPGESIHSPGPVGIGVFRDLGW